MKAFLSIRPVFRGAMMGALLAVMVGTSAEAGPLRDRIKERFQDQREESSSAAPDATDMDGVEGGRFVSLSCEQKDRLVRRAINRAIKNAPPADFANLSYGPLGRQTYDVYLPSSTARTSSSRPAPILVMVHGGAWCIGDKSMDKTLNNKMKHWTEKGFIFVTVNYPMLPDNASVLDQAENVAKALASIESKATSWGGDPDRIVLMGHSAGAHLVSLLGADTQLAKTYHVTPWRGTVSLDSGSMNVPETLGSKPLRLYTDAFGSDPDYWLQTSPLQHLNSSSLPWLGVCSTTRQDSCPQADAYKAKLDQLGIPAGVVRVPLRHGDVNDQLGLPGDYTAAVDQFIDKLVR